MSINETQSGSAPQIGVGLRTPHYTHLESEPETRIQWFEALSENYMSTEGRPLEILTKIRSRFPVALHGVGMSIGSVDGSPEGYLTKLKDLVDRIEPFLVSDHLCFTGLQGRPTHDLLPLPYTLEAIDTVSQNIHRAQEFLGREIAIENVSSYTSYDFSEMEEWDFVTEIQKRTGCHLLLDVNNVFVSATNHKYDPQKYIDGLPLNAVRQMHLAGHTDMGDFLFDTHSKPVCDEVWDLLHYTKTQLEHAPALLLEWDDDIPEWNELESEAMKSLEVWNR